MSATANANAAEQRVVTLLRNALGHARLSIRRTGIVLLRPRH